MIEHGTLRTHLERLMPQAIKSLRQMVETNSFTHNADGVNRVGEQTAELFAPLGFVADHVQAIECALVPTPPLGRHVLLRRPHASGPRVGLVGHLDTVFSPGIETVHQFHWHEDNGRITGPGVIDIKGGNVLLWMVLHALHVLGPDVFESVDWRPLFNAAEEGLSSDFPIHAQRELGRDALACLVFEGGEQDALTSYVVTQRKGSIGLRVCAHGRAAHAGADHARGINAIVQLARVVGSLNDITDYSHHLTANVGVIRGGTVCNQVPDFAEAELELRAFDVRVLDEALACVMAYERSPTVRSAADDVPARISIDCHSRHPSWSEHEGTQRLLRTWQEAGSELSIRVAGKSRGGLSDGNYLHAIAPTLDGLGPVGGNFHCSARSACGSLGQEYVLTESFVPRAMLNVLAIERLVLDARTQR